MRTSSSRLRAFPVLMLVVLALGLTACGSSDSGGETTSGSSGGGASNSASNAQDAAQTKLRDCLREQGLELPAAGGGAPAAGVDQDKLQAAFDGPCKQEQQAAFGNVTQDDQQQFSDQLTKFTSCMRKEGVDVPDATTSGGPPDASAIDQDDPKVQAAVKNCQGQLRQGGAGGLAGGGR